MPRRDRYILDSKSAVEGIPAASYREDSGGSGEKPPCCSRTFLRGVAHHVRCAEPLGTLLALKLDGFAFVQSPVTGILNRREVHKHVLATGPLDKPVALCSIEPLHYAMLFHLDTPSLLVLGIP